MYRITRSVLKSDNKTLISYGIRCQKYRYDNITTDRKMIKRLCRICNRNRVADVHLGDIVDDFLYDLKVN